MDITGNIVLGRKFILSFCKTEKITKKMEERGMAMIDLYAKNPYQHDIGEKVMGYHIFRTFSFICGTIVDREHDGDSNRYIIESEHGDDFSGTLFETDICFYDEDVVQRELNRRGTLTIRVPFKFGVIVIAEDKDGKEIFCQDVEDDKYSHIDERRLLKSFEELLKYLGFKTEDYVSVEDDNIFQMKFVKEVGNINVLTICISKTSVIIKDKDDKEIIRKVVVDLEDLRADPSGIIESFEELLKYLGFYPDLNRMYMGDSLMVLKFGKEEMKNALEEENEIRNKRIGNKIENNRNI